MTAKRIVLVGHCGPDGFALRNAMQSFAPGAVVESVSDDDATSKAAMVSDLLVVNRLLDGDFDASSGVALIRELALRGVASRHACCLSATSVRPRKKQRSRARCRDSGSGISTQRAHVERCATHWVWIEECDPELPNGETSPRCIQSRDA